MGVHGREEVEEVASQLAPFFFADGVRRLLCSADARLLGAVRRLRHAGVWPAVRDEAAAPRRVPGLPARQVQSAEA